MKYIEAFIVFTFGIFLSIIAGSIFSDGLMAILVAICFYGSVIYLAIKQQNKSK